MKLLPLILLCGCASEYTDPSEFWRVSNPYAQAHRLATDKALAEHRMAAERLRLRREFVQKMHEHAREHAQTNYPPFLLP
jgi:hypothetical protein